MRDSIRLVATVRSANPSSRHSSSGAHAVAHFQLEIPQQGDEFADPLRLLFRQPALAEHQHVDVRQRVQLAAAVAADRHQRGFRDIFEAVEVHSRRGRAIDEVAARRRGLSALAPASNAAASHSWNCSSRCFSTGQVSSSLP